jgi:hypothetical protein
MQGIGAPLSPMLGAGFRGCLVVLARFPGGDCRIEIFRRYPKLAVRGIRGDVRFS